MTSIFLTDFLMSRNNVLQQALVCLFIAVCVSVGVGNLYCIIPMVMVTVGFSRTFTLFARDEQNGWQRYRLTFPVTRGQIIAGRMLAIFALTLASALYGLVLTLLIAVIIPLVGVGLESSLTLASIEAPALALAFGAALLLLAIMFAVTVPMVTRFGMTKAVRFIPAAAVLVVLLFGIFLSGTGSGPISMLSAVLDANVWLSTFLMIGASLLIYVGAAFLSMKAYESRQF